MMNDYIIVNYSKICLNDNAVFSVAFELVECFKLTKYYCVPNHRKLDKRNSQHTLKLKRYFCRSVSCYRRTLLSMRVFLSVKVYATV